MFVRIRPLSTKGDCGHTDGEAGHKYVKDWDATTVKVQEDDLRQTSTFNVTGVIQPEIGQEEAYDTMVGGLVEAFKTDSNVLFFAYGQTGSGKTHTMLGEAHHLPTTTPGSLVMHVCACRWTPCRVPSRCPAGAYSREWSTPRCTPCRSGGHRPQPTKHDVPCTTLIVPGGHTYQGVHSVLLATAIEFYCGCGFDLNSPGGTKNEAAPPPTWTYIHTYRQCVCGR